MGTYYTGTDGKQKVGPVTLVGDPTNGEEYNSDPVDDSDFFKSAGQLAAAGDIAVETASFNANFNNTDDNLQTLLDKLDDLSLTAKTTEEIQDIVGALLASGTGVDVTYDDIGNALTFTLADETFTVALKNKLDAMNLYIDATGYEYTETYTYFLITKDGEWTINRFTPTGVKTIANEINNSGTVDGATAWTNRLTLTYS